MNEQEIRACVMHVRGAIANNDEKAALDAIEIHKDFNRIADALEKMASKG
jgi:hypothetical protein